MEILWFIRSDRTGLCGEEVPYLLHIKMVLVEIF